MRGPRDGTDVQDGSGSERSITLDQLSVELDERSPSDAALLQAILDSTYDGILVIDLDGRIVRWNQRLVSMWRIPEGIVASADLGRALEHFTTQVADPTRFMQRINTLLASPRAEHFDVIEMRDGRVFERYSLPMLLRDELVGRVVSYRDVTARENAERTVREREEQLAEEQRLAQIGSWDLNLRTGEATWSEELFRLFGCSPDDFAPSLTHFLNHVHEEDRVGVREALMATAPHQAFDSVYRVIRRDGSVRVVHSNGRIVEVDEPEFVVRGFSQDITEKHELQHQMHQTEKMNALGRLAGGIAHDLNNLLTAVFGSCETLHDEGLSERGRTAAAEIEIAASSAAALMGQLLDLSRQRPSSPQVFDVNAALEPLGRLIRSVIREDTRLNITSDVRESLVRMQKSQLEQIVLNLVINSRDAMPDGGAITIATSSDYIEGSEPFANEMSPGSYIVLSVADTGTGMDRETLDRAFEPFFTTKKDGQVWGTGLGLSSVYGIVKQLGGNVLIDSRPGGGTRVRVLLPEAREIDAESNPIGAPDDLTGDLTGDETVMVVEDDRAVREVIRRGLESYGYRVVVASDPFAAIELSDEHRGGIDLLVTDVVMPGMNGREMAEQVLAAQPQASVLYVSGYPRDYLDGADLGDPSTWFLQKPIRLTRLAAKVRELLDREPDHAGT